MALSDNRIKALALEVDRLGSEIEKLEKKWKKKRKLITSEMKRRKVTGLEYDDGEQVIQISYVAAERVSYSVDKARKVLPDQLFEEVTKLEIDKQLLEKLVLEGTITPSVAAKFSSQQTSTAYPRITIK